MGFPTSPAYIQHVEGWPEHTREHPLIDWMFDYEKALDFGDMKSGSYAPWHTDDFVFVRSGIPQPAGEPSWKKLVTAYSIFTAHYHEPSYYVIHETTTGWELIGEAKLYVNLPVSSTAEKVKDAEGREWDLVAPSAFHFLFVKDSSGLKGIKMQKQVIHSSDIGLAKELVKRGMVTWDEVAEM
jgi:hypothetical protein